MLKVSSNKRFLIHDNGKPFFYLGDTTWEIFHRLDRADAEIFLRDRAAKSFTVMQSVVLAEEDGLNDPNPYGHRPLIDNDPAKPNDAYFEHVDFTVNLMESLGIWCGMLPTWGDKWNASRWGVGPEVFTPENARVYGEWLARRYRDKPIIWILGGDRHIDKPIHREIQDALAAGLRAGDEGRHLITFHPTGRATSSTEFHHAEWLDFNMWQTGHTRNTANWQDIAHDYALTPTKPCIDGEPAYEDHPSQFDVQNGYIDAYDNRKSLYWALFAGAHGHTYGCHPIWQFFTWGRTPKSFCRHTWQEAMHFPGSGQMQFAKKLIESRPFLSRIPDQSLIVGDAGSGAYHVQATRDADGSYAFVYLAALKPVTIDLSNLSGDALDVHWYNPRNGAAQYAGRIKREGTHEFTPPQIWPDWVLVLDDASAGYPVPGSTKYA